MTEIDPQTYQLRCDGCKQDVLLRPALVFRRIVLYAGLPLQDLIGLCVPCAVLHGDDLERQGYVPMTGEQFAKEQA